MAKLQANFAQMAATMAAARSPAGLAASGKSAAQTYGAQTAKLAEMNAQLRSAAVSSGQWHTQQVRTISASQAFTQQMMKQNIGMKQAMKHIGQYRRGFGALNEAIREQHSLRNAMGTQMTNAPFGRNTMDMYMPRGLGSQLDMARTKYGMINQLIGSAAAKTINWGKNTQWAGRQLMVGLTVPLGLIAVGSAALALSVDKNLTRIQKVYDTVNQSAEGQERELAQLRETSLKGATRLAMDYGQKMQDVLDIEAQLAATGLNGPDLHRSTAEVTRISTLGEMKYQDAINMTISLQTAFKLNNEELTESFNMMNAVENATSLSIQDIAESVPRAASALSSLGGTVSEMTVMLVAMKESGVDAAEAANALKSATTRLLNPTAGARNYFEETFGINLNEEVEKANGNIYELMQTLAGLTAGFDDLAVQKGIGKLFGTYQFNRINALWGNLGDAINGVQNQTAKAMETVGKSSEELAGIADREMERWQNSIQGKFKRAVEGIKASLIPLGETVLKVFTPVMQGIANLLQGFNSLSPVMKTIILGFLGFVAIAGPILMIIGIFGNLIGQVARLGTGIAGLMIRFRALSTEEAAMAIAARNAKSSFDVQAASAGTLTMQLATLTKAMEANMMAQGMMTSTGMIGMAGATRQVVQRPNGSYAYAAGSVYPAGTTNAKGKDISGKSAAGHNARAADVAAFKAMKQSTAGMAKNAQTTRTNMAGVGKIVGVLAVAALAMTAISAGSDQTLNTWINIAFMVAIVASTGVFGLALKGAKLLLGYMGLMVGRAVLYANAMYVAAGAARVAAGGGLAGAMSGALVALKGFGAVALRVLGPIGLIAGGVLLAKALADNIGDAERNAAELAKSGQAWADAVGFTYSPGVLPGAEPEDNTNAISGDDIEKFIEDNEDLADALIDAAEAGRIYEVALGQALKAVSSGASPEQARKVMEMALTVAGVKPLKVKGMMIEFDKLDLADPEEIREQLNNLLGNAFDTLDPGEMGIRNNIDGVWDTILAPFRDFGGGDLSDAAREAGERAGAALGDALGAAADDVERANLFDAIESQLDTQFEDALSNFSSDSKSAMEAMGITTAGDLRAAIERIGNKVQNGIELTDMERDLRQSIAIDDVAADFIDQWDEMMDNIIQGLVDSGQLGEEQAKTIRDAILSIPDLQEAMGVPEPAPMLKIATATQMWADYLANAEMHGRDLSEEEKLLYLNTLRARASLDAAADSAQGFGNEAVAAAMSAETLAEQMANAVYTADQLSGSQKDAMSGAWNDILGEADRQFQEHQDATIEAVRAAGDAEAASLEAASEAMADMYEAREKALDDQFEAAETALENKWDHQREVAESYWEARIQKVQDAIDAEEEAENVRQRIFEAEQRRISRMSEQFSAGIDFNVALRSGDLDEAARVANNMGAQTQQWASEDAQEVASLASEKRKEALQAEMDAVQKAKDVALEALEAREEAEKNALDARKERATEALRVEREVAEKGLQAQKDASRKATEDAVAAAQHQADADRRGLADRLRALQEFIPTNQAELEAHTAEVEAIYREYGLDLTEQGRGWAQVIGNALDVNVAAAAAALQTEIKWGIIAQNIADQIGEGLGMTMDQVVAFLKTGTFPAGTAVTTSPWMPPRPAGESNLAAGYRGPLAFGGRHSGGRVNYTGGKFMSQADRVGVPRSANTFPSEVPTLLRMGEFVMNARATQKNRDALEAMNRGKNFPSNDDHKPYGLARHEGGPLGFTAAMVALQHAAAMKIAQVAATKKIQNAQAAAASAAAMMGGLAPGMLGGGNAGTGTFTPRPSGWPARQAGVISPNTAGAVAYIKSRFPQITSVGTLGPRPNVSDHPMGKAADFMIPSWNSPGGIALGDQVARYFVENPSAFGTNYVIWRKRITSGGGWENYTHPNGDTTNPTLNHYDHVHTSFFHKGGGVPNVGFKLPNLNKGGIVKYDNTLANLHKDEAILTKPLTDNLRETASGGGTGGGDTYHTVLDLRGAYIKDEVDVQRAMDQWWNKKEARKGRGRTIT